MFFNFFVIGLVLFFSNFPHKFDCIENIFKDNIGNQMTIGLTEGGYKHVKLKCGSNSMVAEVEMEEDFNGVVYTRGSFYEKRKPCFIDSENQINKRIFKLNIPFDKCKTNEKENIFSNTLVLQHDKELIMPGDLAFSLDCDFTKPRDILVETSLSNVSKPTSRITLKDPDPNESKLKVEVPSAENYGDSVILLSTRPKLPKEEL